MHINMVLLTGHKVSMKSGLGDRNNGQWSRNLASQFLSVSMKSGLGDRNNLGRAFDVVAEVEWGLNEVRS